MVDEQCAETRKKALGILGAATVAAVEPTRIERKAGNTLAFSGRCLADGSGSVNFDR